MRNASDPICEIDDDGFFAGTCLDQRLTADLPNASASDGLVRHAAPSA